MLGAAGAASTGCISVCGDGVVYLKTDADNAADFDAEGLKHRIYNKAGVPMAMSYRRAPDAAYDEPAMTAEWGALAAAVRPKATKRQK